MHDYSIVYTSIHVYSVTSSYMLNISKYKIHNTRIVYTNFNVVK